jgi:hypothetical protein
MPEPQRRRWLQLHLATCIVLMFVAGVLAWANLRDPGGGDVCSEPGESLPFEDRYCGWPYCWHSHEMKSDPMRVYWKPLALDAAIGLAILSVAGVLTEMLLRHRERRQP